MYVMCTRPGNSRRHKWN